MLRTTTHLQQSKQDEPRGTHGDRLTKCGWIIFGIIAILVESQPARALHPLAHLAYVHGRGHDGPGADGYATDGIQTEKDASNLAKYTFPAEASLVVGLGGRKEFCCGSSSIEVVRCCISISIVIVIRPLSNSDTERKDSANKGKTPLLHPVAEAQTLAGPLAPAPQKVGHLVEEGSGVPQQDDEELVPAKDVVPGGAVDKDVAEAVLLERLAHGGLEHVVGRLEAGGGHEQQAPGVAGARHVGREGHVEVGVLVSEEDPRDEEDASDADDAQRRQPGELPVVAHHGDGHEVRGAGEQHHVGHDVVVVGRDEAPTEVAQRDGVGGSREDLGVAAGDDHGFENVCPAGLDDLCSLFGEFLTTRSLRVSGCVQ